MEASGNGTGSNGTEVPLWSYRPGSHVTVLCVQSLRGSVCVCCLPAPLLCLACVCGVLSGLGRFQLLIRKGGTGRCACVPPAATEAQGCAVQCNGT